MVDFLPLFTGEITFVTFCLHSHASTLFCKGVYSRRKEFAPKVSKVFSLRMDPFSKGDIVNVDRVTFLGSVSFSLNVGQIRTHSIISFVGTYVMGS